MSYTIAIAGKGGTGKTTVAALLVRLISEQKLGSVLAVDADPNSNLGEALGLVPRETIGSILDRIAAHPDKIPSGMSKDRFIEYEVQSAVEESDGFDVLTMGRPEGPGCYCYVNNVLRNCLGKLMRDYDYIIIDNEAGLEHLSRRTTRSADALVVICDATSAGLRAAHRINELVKELNIKAVKRLLLVNRSGALEKEKLFGLDLQYIGSLPEDTRIQEISLNGASLTDLSNDAVSLVTLREIGEKVWK
ncbi:MAG: AAA family ATPase [Candidatus Omnitrophota bacterium]